jgi:fumarylpyruvate hydrolase
MIWSLAEQIAILSRFYTLAPGDIIMTGTPEGVNAVERGNVMIGTIGGLPRIRVKVA